MKTAQDIFEALLESRGLAKDSSFLKPAYELSDPYLLPDIKPALKRIEFAIKNKQKIYVYGDYDIDGLTATTLLLETFKQLDVDIEAFIPDRFKDGYGLNKSAIKRIAEEGANLIITVDTGSIASEEIKYAKAIGVDVIVTDHHSPKAELPEDAVAIINPKRPDSKYPYIELAGVGVAFMLVRAMQKAGIGIDEGQEKWLLDLVALGTVCDIVPLTGENRVLVYYGLKVLKKTKHQGLRELADKIGIELDQVNTFDIGYRIGPRLNASGRLEHANKSLSVLKGEPDLNRLVDELEELNSERRNHQSEIFKQALKMKYLHKDSKVPVFYGEDWNHGVVGIVASKLVEELKKPVFVLSQEGDYIKGSARSFGDFHLAKAIEHASDHIEKGGGHAFAAGVTLKPDKLDDFKQALEEFYDSLNLKDQANHLKLAYDLELDDLKGVNLGLLDLIEQLEPFGNSNEKPMFRFKNLNVAEVKKVGSEEKHLKLRFSDGESTVGAIFFNAPNTDLQVGEVVDAIVELNRNIFRNNVYFQFIVRKIF